MTGNKVLLDTNIVSALLKGDNSISKNIDKCEQVYIPSVVFGESYYGAAHSARIAENTADIVELSEDYDALSIDVETAEKYGTLKSFLRKRGTPIPENDIWIAALALQHSIPLATRDKHFKNIENLKILNW